jgi:cubilin
VCGGNLEGSDHGEFSSPGYPGNYPHDRDCVWTISVSPGNNIMFTFATLDLEVHPDCNYDYLEVIILSSTIGRKVGVSYLSRDGYGIAL